MSIPTSVEEFTDLGPAGGLAVALFMLGLLLKSTPKVPNWVIPLVLPAVGAGVYPCIADYSVMNTPNPAVMSVMIGFFIGAGPIAVHQSWRQFQGRKDDGEPEQSEIEDKKPKG